MKTTRRALAGALSLLVAWTALPPQAAAQIVTGGQASGGISGVSGSVPRIELGGASLTPLSPTLGLVPTLNGSLIAPTLSAPSLAGPSLAIPVLPVSALAPKLAAASMPGAVHPILPTVPGAPAKAPADAKGQLALTGERLTAAASKNQDQGGILDSFFTGAKELAATIGEPVAGVPSALSPALSAASVPEGKATPPTPITLEAMALDQTQTVAARQAAVAQLALTPDSKAALERVADANPQGGAADYEVHRAALVALAEAGVVKTLRPVSAEHKAEILKGLVENKPASVVSDYDDTINVLKTPITPRVAASLAASAALGVNVAILTDRPDVRKNEKDVSILDSIESMTPAQKSKLVVGSNSGARLTTFDAEGKPVVAFDAALKFTDAQAAAITAASAKTAGKFGRYEYNGSEENLGAFKWVRFLPLGMSAETVAAAEAFMQAELDAAGAGVKVSGRQAADPKNPSYLSISLLDKTVGVKALQETQGFSGPMLVLGDSFFGTRTVDSDMTKAAPKGSLSIAVGGVADPRLANIFVWDTKGEEATAEIMAAVATPKPAAPKTGLRKLLDKALNLVGWNAPDAKAPGADDAINWKTFLGQLIPTIPSMAAYMLVTIAFVSIAVPVVGWTGYGLLMSISPAAGIAASKIMGGWIKNRNPTAKRAMALNTLLRVGSLMLLPTFYFFGAVNLFTLILGALAEGWLLSSMLMTSATYNKVLYPAKKLGTISGAMFMLFPAVQFVLGTLMHFGHYADVMNPALIFALAAAVNLLVVLPVTWMMIPNVRLSDKTPERAARAPFTQRVAAALKANWKSIAAVGAGTAVFAALTWSPLATLPFIVAHKALQTSLPIILGLLYWILSSPAAKALRRGDTGEVTAEEKALGEKRVALEAEIAAGTVAKQGELDAVNAEIATYKGRSWKAISMMSLGTMMYYPLYLIAAPHVAEILAGPEHKGAMIGQFLGALFLGSWISTAARTKFPDVRVPFTQKTIGVHRIVQAAVAVLAGVWAGTMLFPGSALAFVGAAALVAALTKFAERITDRGWIKMAGLGFSMVWLPFAVWMWPAAFPFLTVQLAMFIALIAAGLFNGPTFVSMIVYLQRNTKASENSEVQGTQGSLFNASISIAYAVLTILSGFLNPAYPMVLALLGVANLVIGSAFWRAPSKLPGLAPGFFTPKAPKK